MNIRIEDVYSELAERNGWHYKNSEDVYSELAERNGWHYKNIDGRAYFFLKDETGNPTNNYAVPDKNTSDLDRNLLYCELAERNGWEYSFSERPYFLKGNGVYATPNETTSQEDKEFLASIICEGSSEMKTLILKCWKNQLKIAGPCSAIEEYHTDESHPSVHFGFKGPNDILLKLHKQYKSKFEADLNDKVPEGEFDIFLRLDDISDHARLDINILLNNSISKELSESIFKKMNELFDNAFEKRSAENDPKAFQ